MLCWAICLLTVLASIRLRSIVFTMLWFVHTHDELNRFFATLEAALAIICFFINFKLKLRQYISTQRAD